MFMFLQDLSWTPGFRKVDVRLRILSTFGRNSSTVLSQNLVSQELREVMTRRLRGRKLCYVVSNQLWQQSLQKTQRPLKGKRVERWSSWAFHSTSSCWQVQSLYSFLSSVSWSCRGLAGPQRSPRWVQATIRSWTISINHSLVFSTTMVFKESMTTIWSWISRSWFFFCFSPPVYLGSVTADISGSQRPGSSSKPRWGYRDF